MNRIYKTNTDDGDVTEVITPVSTRRSVTRRPFNWQVEAITYTVLASAFIFVVYMIGV